MNEDIREIRKEILEQNEEIQRIEARLQEPREELARAISVLERAFDDAYGVDVVIEQSHKAKLKELDEELREEIVAYYEASDKKKKTFACGLGVMVKSSASISSFAQHADIMKHVEENFPTCITYDAAKLIKQAGVYTREELPTMMPYIHVTDKTTATIKKTFWTEIGEENEPASDTANETN